MGARPALAIHPGALGDVLLAVPALRALRAGGPLALAAQPRVGALLHALDVVHEALAFDSLRLDALFTDDAARVPALARFERLVSWFGARDPAFTRRLRALVPGAVVAPSVRPGVAVWEHLLETVGAPAGEWRAPIALPEGVRALGAEALVAAGMDAPRPWLFVHPGAGGAAKQWPAQGFARVVSTLAARARINVLVHQGPADAAAVAALRRHLGEGAVALTDPALPALAGALARAAVFVGNDSGVSHLAAALGVPSLILFDARHLDWRPWWPGARVRTVTLTALEAGDAAAVVEDLLELLQ
ncbi:MAG TPA: glycosyltransferase family 9 protein [Methylomirabilota bacterium]|nr:glycosyltransferase family 9 protein [Methylomirabilota bacterium]